MQTKANIVTSTEKMYEIEELISKGYSKGYRMPFYCMDELYSMKLGATSYIVGHEYSGKSELSFELMVWLSKKYGLSHCIFSPETGNSQEIFAEIAHKWLGKPIIGEYAVSKEQVNKVLQTISRHFHVIEVDEEIDLETILDLLATYEKKIGYSINTVTIDPFNELQWNMNGLPRDMWLENTLGKIRRVARKENKHITIVTHPIESDRMYHKEGFWLSPTRKQYAGGQGWARKGESMIAFWRPPFENSNGESFLDEHGIPYEKNEAHFIVQKSKPKGTGKLGKAILYFDWQKSAYYETIGTKKYYAGEWYLEHEECQPPIGKNINPVEFDFNNREENPF
jgi:hypothetical protein